MPDLWKTDSIGIFLNNRKIVKELPHINPGEFLLMVGRDMNKK